MHIVDMVYFWARTKPLHPAVIEPAGIITYVNLAHAIETAAQHLTQAITNRSKPVAISINNSPKMLVALFGLLRAGFSVVLANPTVFKHLAAAGASTLVYERNTATMDGLANVQFDDRWIKLWRKRRQDKCAASAEQNGRWQYNLFYVWYDGPAKGRGMSAEQLATACAIPVELDVRAL